MSHLPSWQNPKLDIMDPSMFLQYSPPNGLPQESKLATYMNRSMTTPSRSLNQTLGKLTLDSSPTSLKKVLIGEFIPVNYYTPANLLPESPENSPPSNLATITANTQVHQENVGGTTYFYTNPEGLNSSVAMGASLGPEQCLNATVGVAAGVPSGFGSQMYAGAPTHLTQLGAKPGLAATFYMSETIRSELYQRNEEMYMQSELHQYSELPENVEIYSDLSPLETPLQHTLASSFRCVHRQSGEYYAIRRLHSFVGGNGKQLELWTKVDHPNIVKLHEYFTTKAFNDHSMVLVYDYHPGSVTLMSKYLANSTANSGSIEANGPAFHDPFSSDPDAPRPYTHQKNAMLRAVACGALLPEAVLWSLLVQLTAALRTIHAAGLACRNLDPTKVVMSGCRVRIAWCGTADAMHPTSNIINDVAQAQQDDLSALGRLALALACRTIHCDNLPASMDLVARTYSADLKNLILYLLSTTPARRSVTDLMPMIGARFYTQVEALERRADVFEEQLAHEIDNGRLLRILVKFGVINERPELNMNPAWSETGDRYMLKLFRDYLFHSVTPDGRPWLDQAHLTYCLNQLDAGSINRVQLMSRDEQSVLVVSYAELKHCLDQAFDEIMQAAMSAP